MKKVTLLILLCFVLSNTVFSQQIGVFGNGNNISDNDVTPVATDFTDFQNNLTRVFSIENVQNGNPPILTITSITLSNTAAFTISSPLADNTITKNQTEPFTITFNNPSAGTFTSTVTISSNATNGGADNVWIFTIRATGTSPTPEINITGLSTTILDGDPDPTTADGTDFGSVSVGGNQTRTFTIQNTGSFNLTVGAIIFTGLNAAEFSVTSPPSATVTPSGSTTFVVTFTPLANGTRTATIQITNNDSNENPYNFVLQGNGVAPLTEGPGGVTADLALWLKGTDGLGYTDGQAVSLWIDQGRGADATVNTTGQEPTYFDNPTNNINFNPVVDFDNSYNPVPLDGDFSYDDTSTQFLEGPSGLYTQDIFMVVLPDTTVDETFGSMDLFCGDENPSTDETDATGLGLGAYSVRFTGEIISYAVGTTSSGNGYGVAEIGTGNTYNNVGIINTRNNTAATQQELYYNGRNIETTQNDLADFSNVNDSRYWIGRSEGWEASTDAKIAEIITFSARKDDSNLTTERNRILSYLAIKYGITLGINGTSQDYVDSSGTVIWDQSENTGIYNFDITGIGRDDNSDLNQKQSKSINSESDGVGEIRGLLTMGLTEIHDTNNENISTNTDTFEDQNFLLWGNNNGDLNSAPNVINVDLSDGITGLSSPVTFTGMERVWKVVEVGGDVSTVKVSIPQAAIRNIAPPGDYLMFISDTGVFNPTADYRIMTQVGDNLETLYDFDGTKYITFGYAPERVYERSIYFDGLVDYIDMSDALDLNTSGFTISSWLKRETGSNDTSILSKRNTVFTEGYDFKISALGKLEIVWKNGLITYTATSNTTIPLNEWHHVAVIYDGAQAFLYIDGVLDNSVSIAAPVATTQSFYIGAAGKNIPVSHYRGNIDEVRVWNIALNLDQLRFIMNQEIESNAMFTSGKIMPTSITKNDVASLPWSNLAGYYPLSTYTYTNTKDESGNGNTGALKNLNTVDYQTAPLPYRTNQDGTWNNTTTWLNGNTQQLPGSTSIVDNTATVDWNIVETSHNITLDNSVLPLGNNNRSVLGLFINSNTLTVDGNTASNIGNGLTVTHYLKLDGDLDLEGESQLIQSEDSDLDVTSAGTLERDQQGTEDLYTYNYWASPVGVSNTSTNNNSYTLPDVLLDGKNPATPLAINFITNSYNGTPNTGSAPIGIADFWIWKYANLSSDYYNWQHVRSTGSILAGEGYTMKGVNDTSGNVALEQNYVFRGKPNNGNITLPIANGSEYLVGNPYASAIDADQFIADNTDTTGTLYFWEHFGGGTHSTSGYQGGYATYTLSGAVPAMQFDYSTGGTTTGGTPTKLPGQYIPVSQGFFVTGSGTGTINFNNGQRIFQKEGTTSVFMKNSNNPPTTSVDNRLKIRLGFKSVNSTYGRQILVTQDSNATPQLDFGYDGETTEANVTDMYWTMNSKKYVIQGTNIIEATTILPLGIHTNENGINSIKIDALENVPSDLEIYIYDTVTTSYYDIRNNPEFSIDLPAGEYLDRFELRFANGNSLSTDAFETESGIQYYFANNNETIVIGNPNFVVIKTVELFNLLGQSIIKFDTIETENTIELKTNNVATGTYIIQILTDQGKLSKKVLID